MEYCLRKKLCLENEQDYSTPLPDYKSSSQVNMAGKSTIITEPSDLVTNNYYIDSNLPEMTDVNALFEAALVRLGYVQVSRDLIYDALDLINKLLS